jgi:hypothetical protein
VCGAAYYSVLVWQRCWGMGGLYFGWNAPSARSSRIFFRDSSDSGVQRYNLSSRLLRDRVQSMAGLPRLRGGAPPGVPGFMTLPSLTLHITKRKDVLHSSWTGGIGPRWDGRVY